jgi:hypothetical protein
MIQKCFAEQPVHKPYETKEKPESHDSVFQHHNTFSFVEYHYDRSLVTTIFHMFNVMILGDLFLLTCDVSFFVLPLPTLTLHY